MTKKCNIAIFASGAGSNAKKIIQHFANHTLAQVSLIVCNKKNAGVFDIAKEFKIPSVLLDKTQFLETDYYVNLLKNNQIDLIILAGFLLKVPTSLVNAFPERIINIHPALLPKFGGKGMYGKHVHEAVIAASEEKSGITIHLVDEFYDHGKHLFQADFPITEGETADSLANKIHQLEHLHFSQVIENYIKIACID